MPVMRTYLLALFLVAGPTNPAWSQNEFSYPSQFSVLSAVPRGCLEIPPAFPDVPADQVLLDGVVQQDVPLVAQPGESGTVAEPETVDVRVRVWRHGCHEPNRSALVMNLSLPEGVSDEAAVLLDLNPVAELRDEDGVIPLTAVHWEPGVSNLFSQLVGVYGYIDGLPTGVTYILDSESYSQISQYPGTYQNIFSDTVSRYNEGGELRLLFAHDLTVTGEVPPYNPSFDRPQLSKPSFTGRMSGQWIADSLPSTGLLLQIGEVPQQYRNFIFAIWFTYIDGQPVWMAGNQDIEVGTNEVTLDMGYFDGGKLFTTTGGFNSSDISSSQLGTMKIKVVNCNQIAVTADFSSSSLGSNSLLLDRLIRIAGHDCDGTQAIR